MAADDPTKKTGAVHPKKASEETAQKAEEARRLMAEIGKLQTGAKARSSMADLDAEIQAEEKTGWLAERIMRLEQEQQEARGQINKLAEAKKRLELAAQKSKERETKQQQAAHAKLQQQLNQMIAEKEKEYEHIRTQIQLIRDKSEKETGMLKAERDAARNLAQEQNDMAHAQLGLPDKRKKIQKMIIMGSAGIMAVLILGVTAVLFIDKIPFLHELVAAPPPRPEPVVSAPPGVAVNQNTGGDSTAATASNTATQPPPAEKERPPQHPLEAVKSYRDKLRSGALGPIMVEIPGGKYLLGVNPVQPYPDELPQTEVTLRNFSISRYEITLEEYMQFANAAGAKAPRLPGHWKDNMPVANVSWEDAVDYTQWLSSQTGRQYRLPSEREWEYAASAGMKTVYPWGDDLGTNKANCASCGSPWDGKQPAPAGSFEPNSLGLYDMIGNVEEWIFECLHTSYKGTPASGQVWEGGDDCTRRMVRGGSYRTYMNELRVTKRKSLHSKSRSPELGFRIIRAH